MAQCSSYPSLSTFALPIATPRSRPSPLSSLFLHPSISYHHSACIRILNVNISDLDRMRIKSHEEPRRRAYLGRAKGNEQHNTTFSSPGNLNNPIKESRKLRLDLPKYFYHFG